MCSAEEDLFIVGQVLGLTKIKNKIKIEIFKQIGRIQVVNAIYKQMRTVFIRKTWDTDTFNNTNETQMHSTKSDLMCTV